MLRFLKRFSSPVLRNIFLVSCVLLACSALFPVLWHLWIYAGSANSNFYYAITLLFNVAQVKTEALLSLGFIHCIADKVKFAFPGTMRVKIESNYIKY